MFSLQRVRALTPRQTQMADLVARGMSNSEIAQQTGLAVITVKKYVSAAADRLPGDTPPRHKLTIWFLSVERGIG